MSEIHTTRESMHELQKFDCNCSDCAYMVRDVELFNRWAEWHKGLALSDFTRRKEKAISDASKIDNERQREGMLRVANKMKFQFSKEGLIAYGNCTKYNKGVTFLMGVCQLETQQCFVHRKTQY